MEYERPREKLHSRGAASLSLVELLQIIIGSGGARLSGAKLAREIALLFDAKNISYLSLRAIPGVGEAKACQIIAALELSRRFEGQS